MAAGKAPRKAVAKAPTSRKAAAKAPKKNVKTPCEGPKGSEKWQSCRVQ
jgi:hypothetical protein